MLYSLLFGGAYGLLEYRVIEPLRPSIDSALSAFPMPFGHFYPYHYLVMLPIFLLFGVISSCSSNERLKANLLSLTAWLISSVLVEDLAYFLARVTLPRPDDPRGGLWFSCPLEWTCMGLPSVLSLATWHWVAMALGALMWMSTSLTSRPTGGRYSGACSP